MIYLKIAGVAWGLLSPIAGLLLATQGTMDAPSAIIFTTLFLLPTPLTVVALRAPITAGFVLLSCYAFGLLTDAIVFARVLPGFHAQSSFVSVMAFLSAPDLILGFSYVYVGKKVRAAKLFPK